MKSLGKAIVVGLGAAVLAVAMTAAPASADPNPVTDYRQLSGVGSDTTQDVLNGLGEVVKDDTAAHNKIIASWDARPAGTIKTKATNCAFPRPDGSGNGRTALRASAGEGGGVYQNVTITGCVDFARSSSYGGGSTASTTGNYTYVPFGVDAVSYAVGGTSDLPESLTFVQLQRIYRCYTTSIGGSPVKPLLVQSGSGTRSFWLSKMNITEADIANGDYPCIETLNNTVQEHDGSKLTADHPEYLMPFSAGQYIAQTNSATILTQTGVTVADRRGTAVLGKVNNLSAVTPAGVLNVDFRAELVRDVYNVVPTAKLADPLIAATFVGAGSKVCAQRPTIELFGFGTRTTYVNGLHSVCGRSDLRFDS